MYRSMRPAVPIQSDPALSLNDLIFRHADACPSALALVDSATGQSLTFAAFRSAVLTTAVALSSRAGVRRGEDSNIFLQLYIVVHYYIFSTIHPLNIFSIYIYYI